MQIIRRVCKEIWLKSTGVESAELISRSGCWAIGANESSPSTAFERGALIANSGNAAQLER
jgi:hypothetical protein